jgi:hypothetical protein
MFELAFVDDALSNTIAACGACQPHNNATNAPSATAVDCFVAHQWLARTNILRSIRM